MKKKTNIVKLGFDPKRHDAHITETEAKEAAAKQQARQRQIKKAIHTAWERWKKQLRGKPRTSKDVIAATYALQTLVGGFHERCKECGLEEWHNFSMGLIEDHIASAVSTDIVAANQIVPYVPPKPTLMDSDNDAIVAEQLRRDAKPVGFRTYEEFLEIPFVKAFQAKTDFVGFCLNRNGVVAVFRDGATAGVGFLSNGVAVDKLPSLEDFAAAVDAARTATEESKT